MQGDYTVGTPHAPAQLRAGQSIAEALAVPFLAARFAAVAPLPARGVTSLLDCGETQLGGGALGVFKLVVVGRGADLVG